MKEEDYTIGNYYWFQDLGGAVFLDILVGLSDGFSTDFTFISKHKHIVHQYCPCCAEKEPFIEVDRFEDVRPFIGEIPEWIKEREWK